MVGNNDETSAEQVTFQPELDTLLDLIMDAHYLGVSGLVQVCIVHAVKNFHGRLLSSTITSIMLGNHKLITIHLDIDSLGDLVVIEPVVFQLLEQLPIYQLLRAEKMLPDTYNLDDIWLAKYTTLLRTGGRPRMRDVHSAIDDGTCRQSCVEEFVHQLLDMGKTEQAITLVEQYGDAIRSFRISSVVESTRRQPATLDRLLTADKSIIDLLLPHLHQLSKLDIHGTALSPAAILQLRQIIQRQSGSKLHLQLISCNIALQSFRKLIPSSANSVIEGGAVRSASLTTVNHGGMRVADDERRYLEGALRRVNEEQRSKPSQPTIRQQPFDLSIRNWSGSSSNIATLASLYQSPIVVTSLSFRGMALGELGAEWIAEYLTLRSCPVVNLELARCKLGAAGLQAVCSALAQSSVPLTKLNLSDNYLSSTGMEGGNIGKVLAAALQVQAATLEELDLSGNVLGHLGAVVLIQAIAQSHALRQLDLCRMDLTNGAVRALLQGQFPYLERLALAQNRIVPSQLVEILAWLRQHALQLTTLDIGLNMWNDNVAQTLTDFLLSNTCRLTHLDVEGHPDIATFSRIGSAQLLRSGVMHNHTLTHLNISAQQLSTDDACALIQFGLYGGSKLKQLYIRDNNIERVLSETSLAKALPSKRPLLYVDASGNPITMDVAQWTRQTIAKRGLPLWVDFH